MDKQQLFNKITIDWKNKLNFLDDKPEETLESTIKALWLTASGNPASAEKALNLTMPDLTKKQINYLFQLFQLRVDKIPLSYITGRQNFMGIELICDKRALIPRKETEILGLKALELSKEMINTNNDIKIMDICCGSGNLGIAVAFYNSNCIVYASDISQEAVDLTQENINFFNLNKRIYVTRGDMMSAFESDEYYNKIDLIICNPPYIISSKVPKMDREISLNEPEVAFDGVMLGIGIIQKLIRQSPRFLKPRGWLAFEIGVGQGKLITQICERTNLFIKIKTVIDNRGQIRVILAQKSE